MSYKYSQLAGRLVGASKSLGQGLKPAGPESSIIYCHGTHFKQIKTDQTRESSQYAPMNPKVLSKYNHFQQPDGVPVHLKGGLKDKVFFYGSAALIAYGLGLMAYSFYGVAFPEKKKE